MSGTRTFSSNWPCVPAAVIAASFPITWSPTWITTSGITGFTLPGMIDEPFCSSGRRSSERPARGPEPISARSFAILISETATTLSAPESSTSESRLACASKRSRGAETSMPMSFEISARTFSANSGCVLRPVPVAVPPSGSWPTRSSVERTRSAPRLICAAYPANSWPSVTGTASIRCVRPVFTMSSNSPALRVEASSRARPSPAGGRRSPRPARRCGRRTGRRRSTTGPCSRGRCGERPRPRGSR